MTVLQDFGYERIQAFLGWTVPTVSVAKYFYIIFINQTFLGIRFRDFFTFLFQKVDSQYRTGQELSRAV